MKVAVAGSSGFIGSALVAFLKANGHSAVRIVRKKSNSAADKNTTVYWNPEENYIDSGKLEGVDAIVNLSGENVHGRWTEAKRRRILSSRLKTTSLLVAAMAKLNRPPKVFVSSSGITFYGTGTGEIVDEASPAGSGFLAEVCHKWEESADVASDAGIRVVKLRIGAVLDSSGGMLSWFAPLFRAGLGGKWGTGKQYFSWISLDDLVEIILLSITDDSIHGALNAVSPNYVTNNEFTKTLGKVVSRPTLICVPTGLAKPAFGKDWVESTLLASHRVVPKVLMDRKYRFRYPDLEPALRHSLKKVTRH